MKHNLLTCFLTIILFAILSIFAGPAICLICNFVVLILLGWAVYHEVKSGECSDKNKR